MVFRKVLVGFLMVVMASPVWGGAEAMGNITSSNAATVRETTLAPGSTVFSGDAISVGAQGTTRIAFTNGAQAEVLGNSLVRLAKAGNGFQMVVDRGQASFHTYAGKDMEALVTDASIRSASGSETSAIIQVLSEKHAVIAAQKGALLLTTASNGKTYTIREGEAADLSVASDPQQGGAYPAGKSAPNLTVSRKGIIWIVAVVAGGTAIAAYLLARREKTPSNLANEISPSRLN
jgi:hypothetical protein